MTSYLKRFESDQGFGQVDNKWKNILSSRGTLHLVQSVGICLEANVVGGDTETWGAVREVRELK